MKKIWNSEAQNFLLKILNKISLVAMQFGERKFFNLWKIVEMGQNDGKMKPVKI